LTARPLGAASLYAWGVVVGVASCFVYLPSLTASQLWFPRHRGLASGVFNFAFAASAALLAPVLGWMVQVLGYAPAHYLLAAAVLLLGGGAARGVVRPEAVQSGAGTLADAHSLTPSESLRTRGFWFLCLVWALQGSAGIAMVTLAVPLGLSKGATFGAALIVLTAFSLANGLSRLVVGFLSDRIGQRSSLCAASLAAGVAYLALPAVGGLTATAVLAAVVGVAFGTLFTVSAPLAVECFGSTHFGTIFGLVFISYGFLAGLLGPWLSGVVLDRAAGDPFLACWYLGPFCLAAAALVLGVRRRPGREKPSVPA
ncbi:MAG: MFS transporter, partial [Proteobacteria bacterium]|nr:MFS transporter [Pseudomonadota bacterium]